MSKLLIKVSISFTLLLFFFNTLSQDLEASLIVGSKLIDSVTEDINITVYRHNSKNYQQVFTVETSIDGFNYLGEINVVSGHKYFVFKFHYLASGVEKYYFYNLFTNMLFVSDLFNENEIAQVFSFDEHSLKMGYISILPNECGEFFYKKTTEVIDCSKNQNLNEIPKSIEILFAL